MADKFKSLFPYLSLSSRAVKQLQGLLKDFPNKIYSVEIKIKTQENTQSSVLKTASAAMDSLRSPPTLPPPSPPVIDNPFDPLSSEQHSDSPTSTPAANLLSDAVVAGSTTNKKVNKHICDNVRRVFTQQGEIIDRTKLLTALLNKYSSSMRSSEASIQQLMALNSNLKDLNAHIESHPEANNLLIRENVLPNLLRIRDYSEDMMSKAKLSSTSAEKAGNGTNGKAFTYLNENSRQALSRLGYADPPKGRGIKILSIDGGGK